MNGIQTMFTSGGMLALVTFLAIVLIAAVLTGVLCKSLTAACAVFCGGSVVLIVVFVIRPTWLLAAFDGALAALELFAPFNGVVGGMFSLTAVVYYLSIIGLFLFLTGQAIERRRWA